MHYEGLAEIPYDYAAVAPIGATLFTAGACPLDEEGRVVAPADHRAQAEMAVDNLLAVLDRYRAGPADLLKTTVYVVGDRADLLSVWDVVAARLRPHRPPSTLLGVTAWGTRTSLSRSRASPLCRLSQPDLPSTPCPDGPILLS